jgi:ubiquinone/menaquinone biosynthesis C-methylase UbiE
MQPSEAITMLEPAGWINSTAQTWADLGCGKGIFTIALASLLPANSMIHAIDRNAEDLQFIPAQYQSTRIETIAADFITPPSLPLLDGAIMANALHYVRDQQAFAALLRSMLKPSGRMLIVEYDTDTANRWVPFPLSFNTLEKWAKEGGFRNVVKLKERSSIYQRAKMYSAVLEAGFAR